MTSLTSWSAPTTAFLGSSTNWACTVVQRLAKSERLDEESARNQWRFLWALCKRLQTKELTLTLRSFYKTKRRAIYETANGEQHDLRDALTTLDSLRRIAERQNGYQSKAS